MLENMKKKWAGNWKHRNLQHEMENVALWKRENRMCGSGKYPYPHHRGSLEIPRRRGVLKAKIFKGMYEPKLEFPEG